jgi:hypothetical protein
MENSVLAMVLASRLPRRASARAEKKRHEITWGESWGTWVKCKKLVGPRFCPLLESLALNFVTWYFILPCSTPLFSCRGFVCLLRARVPSSGEISGGQNIQATKTNTENKELNKISRSSTASASHRLASLCSLTSLVPSSPPHSSSASPTPVGEITAFLSLSVFFCFPSSLLLG